MDLIKGIMEDLKNSMEGWNVASCTDIGTSHIKQGKPCQDSVYFEVWGEYLVGAVADGAGSRNLSHIGSRIAVVTAVKLLTKYIRDFRQIPNEKQGKKLFLDVIQKIRDEFRNYISRQQSSSGKTLEIRDLACTLLLFIASPKKVMFMQLGDGFIVVRYLNSKSYDLVFSPAKGEYNNETTFITDDLKYIESDIQVQCKSSSISFMCLSTDGLETLAFDLQAQKAYHNFFVDLEKYVAAEKDLLVKQTDQTDVNERNEYLLRLLSSQEVNSKTDDDKTLLICSSLLENTVPEKHPSPSFSQIPKRLPGSTRQPPSVGANHVSPLPTPPLPNPEDISPVEINSSSYKSPESLPSSPILPDSNTNHPESLSVNQKLVPTTKFSRERKLKNLSLFVLLSNFFLLYFATTFFTHLSTVISENFVGSEQNIKVTIGSIILSSLVKVSGILILLNIIVVVFVLGVNLLVTRDLIQEKQFKNMFLWISLVSPIIALVLGMLSSSFIYKAFPMTLLMGISLFPTFVIGD